MVQHDKDDLLIYVLCVVVDVTTLAKALLSSLVAVNELYSPIKKIYEIAKVRKGRATE
jgi:hypothetical protein